MPPRWICPACGVNNMPQRAACFRCASPRAMAYPHTSIDMPTPQAPRPPTTGPRATAPLEGRLGCPVCGSQETRKVSVVVQSEGWSSVASGHSLSVGQIVHGPAFGMGGIHGAATIGGSHLAQSLAPPIAPQPPGYRNGCSLAILTFSGILGLIGLLGLSAYPGERPSSAMIISAIWSLGAFGGATALLWRDVSVNRRYWRQQPRLIARWKQALIAWDQLFYCHRCDHVFEPRGLAAVRPMDLNQLL